jgi:hypothetical protein
MAELVDALVSGTSILTDVQVRVLFRAQNKNETHDTRGFFYSVRAEGKRLIMSYEY